MQQTVIRGHSTRMCFDVYFCLFLRFEALFFVRLNKLSLSFKIDHVQQLWCVFLYYTQHVTKGEIIFFQSILKPAVNTQEQTHLQILYSKHTNTVNLTTVMQTTQHQISAVNTEIFSCRDTSSQPSRKHRYIINLIVASCIFCEITSIYQQTNAHIISQKTLLKLFKTLRYVSILSDHHQGALFLATFTLQYSQFNSYLQRGVVAAYL